jgi:hypothetical protein
MRDGKSIVQLSITGPNAKAYFKELQQRFAGEIENKLGSVTWRELPEAKESQIQVVRESRPSEREAWPELNQWFAETLETWVEVLRPMVRDLGGTIEDSALVPP